MRILVAGGSGMLGSAILNVARRERQGVVIGGVRSEQSRIRLQAEGFETVSLDVTHAACIDRALSGGIDVVINAAAIENRSRADSEAMGRVNASAPHVLADRCAAHGTRLIQISTDGVFSGRVGMYRETDEPDPIDAYGHSKVAGEVTGDGHLTIRTSFVGRELNSTRGLLEWFLAQTGRVSGYRRAFWSGLTTTALSRVLLTLATRRDVKGILNVASERIDKCSLLHLFAEAYNRTDTTIVPVDEPACDRSLDDTRLRSLGIEVPRMRQMILDFAHEASGSAEPRPARV